MSDSLTFEVLQKAVAGTPTTAPAAAIRLVTRLEPAGKPEDKVFPPTYAGGVYAVENRRVGDKEVRCVQLDSVQSQANRLEHALLRAYEDGKLKFPLMVVDFSQAEGLKDVGRITTLDAPHRIADAIFRDSLLGGKPFRESKEGKAFEAATVRKATALFELCPPALIFGTWDSTGSRGGLGNKFARVLVSEIVAFDATVGVRTSSRIDPLGIEKCELYEDTAGHWTVDQAKAKKDDKGTPLKYGKGKDTKGKPSEINHGNVTPDIARDEKTKEAIGGGVTMSHAIQTTVLSLPGLRRLRFPDEDGKTSAERDHAAWTLLAALALAAVAYQREHGYDLRSRCLLVPAKSNGPFDLVRSASEIDHFTLSAGEAGDLVQKAAKAATKAGLPWPTEEIRLIPGKALEELVRKGREAAPSAVQEPEAK